MKFCLIGYVFIVWVGTVSSVVRHYSSCSVERLSCDWWISIRLAFIKRLFQIVSLSLFAQSCRMDVIDTICDERLALTEILTERRRQLLNVLRNIEVVNLENLDNVLQGYCNLRRNVIATMKSLDVLEEDYRRYRC